jgi:hypothetical protein
MNYWTTQISRRAAFTNEDTPYYTMTGYMLLRVVDDRVCTPQCQWRSARLFFQNACRYHKNYISAVILEPTCTEWLVTSVRYQKPCDFVTARQGIDVICLMQQPNVIHELCQVGNCQWCLVGRRCKSGRSTAQQNG